jgi:hypothetical protein
LSLSTTESLTIGRRPTYTLDSNHSLHIIRSHPTAEIPSPHGHRTIPRSAGSPALNHTTLSGYPRNEITIPASQSNATHNISLDSPSNLGSSHPSEAVLFPLLQSLASRVGAIDSRLNGLDARLQSMAKDLGPVVDYCRLKALVSPTECDPA